MLLRILLKQESGEESGGRGFLSDYGYQVANFGQNVVSAFKTVQQGLSRRNSGKTKINWPHVGQLIQKQTREGVDWTYINKILQKKTQKGFQNRQGIGAIAQQAATFASQNSVIQFMQNKIMKKSYLYD